MRRHGPVLDVRPYELMCVVCAIGRGAADGSGGGPRLSAILAAARRRPATPFRLRCTADSVYHYQNPGRDLDTPHGDLFNEKRDLDILQRMGLAPGDTRPAVDLFDRLLTHVPCSRGICAYDEVTGPAWRGCDLAASCGYDRGRAMGLGAIIPPRPADCKRQAKTESVAEIENAATLRIRPHHLLCLACFHGGREHPTPIEPDNLCEILDAARRDPQIPITLVRGCCMICPPCASYDPATRLCVGGHSMGLRDQKKDLDTLQRLGLQYGDTRPARELFALVFERIPTPTLVCGYGDRVARSPEWSVCGGTKADREEAYRRAGAVNVGLGRPPTEPHKGP